MGGGSSDGGSGADCTLGLTIVSPNLLSSAGDARQLKGRPHIMSALGTDIFSCSESRCCKQKSNVYYSVIYQCHKGLIWMLVIILMATYCSSFAMSYWPDCAKILCLMNFVWNNETTDKFMVLILFTQDCYVICIHIATWCHYDYVRTSNAVLFKSYKSSLLRVCGREINIQLSILVSWSCNCSADKAV